MRRTRRLGVLACLLIAWAWHQGSAVEPMPRPGDGMLANGLYTNKYFRLSYRLPSGWAEAVAGPGPSHSGYYVLATFAPAGELTGTIVITAQDAFFAAPELGDVVEAARAFAGSMSKVEGMTIDRQPSPIAIAGRDFSRVDFSGVGLFRSTLFTRSRCHLVSFNFTAKSPELLAALVLSLDKIGDARDAAAARSDPVCIRDRASPQHLLTKVDPAASGPTFTPIPVRLIIGNDGGVKHVHVIRATVEQRDSIEGALGQWKLKPHAIDGRATEIETGLMIEFRAGGTVAYSAGAGR
jgi:hypothetical protein